jgi:hypothetical protein
MTTVIALKAALLAYTGCQSINPAEAVYCYTYPNGFQEYISYERAAELALQRIEALELELMEVYSDPDIKYIREAKQRAKK